MNKTALVLVSLLGLATLGLATSSRPQSTVELSAQYPVVTAFEVRPGILMTPKYTTDGQVCEMSFERQHATKSGIMLDSVISEKLANEIVDQFAPPDTRGIESDLSSFMLVTGNAATTMEDYANLTIARYSTSDELSQGAEAVVITWKNRTCPDEGEALPIEQYPH